MKIRMDISIFVNLVIDINYVGKKEGEAKVSNFIEAQIYRWPFDSQN